MSLCKAKLQKLDLLSMTESTKAPSALDALDSDEEDRMSLDSVSAITSGKRSKAKPQHMRNENAQAKNLRKAFVFQKLMTKEEADAMTNQQCFAFRELDRENKRAISTLSAAKLEAMKDQERNMVEEMVSFTGWIEAEMGNDITVEEQVQFRKRWLVKTDYGQGYLCQLCGKETYGGLGCPHLMSTTHQEKEREEILMDRVFGTPEARKSRRFGEGCHTPTRAAMRKYWGPNMENLITLLEVKMQCGEQISFKYGESQKAASYMISKNMPYRFHLALIKYDEATGCYRNSTFWLHDVRLWNSLPEIEDEDMERTYEKNQKKGDKWWPVIMCQVGEDNSEAFQEVVPDFIYVVICLYQVLQKPLTAWCVNFIRQPNTITSSIRGPRGALGQGYQIHQDHQDLQDHDMKGPGQAARPRIDVLPKY